MLYVHGIALPILGSLFPAPKKSFKNFLVRKRGGTSYGHSRYEVGGGTTKCDMYGHAVARAT
jgi:hypothetical protein